jgi:UDP-N-acetylglucosamine 2-epimerase (non-hydrolysing)
VKPFIVIGTRPEAIKLAPLIRAFLKQGVSPVVCHTGQHAMAMDCLAAFGLSPTWSLQSVDQLEAAIAEAKPDVVIVQGDTHSALMGAIAGFRLGIPVAHVEAGLRTHSFLDPRPEEFNRRAISLAAFRHFAPTEQARTNLLVEDIDAGTIAVTGNTGVDALLTILDDMRPRDIWPSRPTVLVTSHRRESIGVPLQNICRAVGMLANENRDMHFVWPVHPNPNVTAIVDQHLAPERNLSIVPAMGCVEFSHLLAKCSCVLTDSGGVCEDATTLGIPTVIMRDHTERTEAVYAGLATLAGTSTDVIVDQANVVMRQKPKGFTGVFGAGNASRKIVQHLLEAA